MDITTTKKIEFKKIGSDIGNLVEEKNASYGDSFNKSGDILRILFPNGIAVEKYREVLVITRIIDKLFRLSTNPNYNNENCWQDIAGYAILMLGYDSAVKPAAERLDEVVTYDAPAVPSVEYSWDSGPLLEHDTNEDAN
jgi:hypothetical protein